MGNTEEHIELIKKFYTAFSNKDFRIMAECYHADVEFEDPAFGKLKGAEASKMWEMLLARSKDLTLTYSDIQANEESGSARWIAHYTFSRTGRQVVNFINAVFTFREGKIISHTDSFNLNSWFISAFGSKGYLFIAIPFLRKKFHAQVKQTLKQFISKQAES